MRAAGGLRGRDFRLLWTGETTSALGSSVTAIALPLIALTLGAGVLTVGVLGAVAWLPWLVIGLPAGAWVDRFSPRRIMICCDVVALAAFASIPVAAAVDALTLAQLFVVAALEGVAKVFFSTSYRAMIPSLVADEELVAANARLQGSEQAAQVGGPGLGGLLAQVCGPANALIADAVTFVVSLACLLRMRPDAPRAARVVRPRLRREIAEGVRVVVGDPLLRTFALNGAFANLALTGSNVLMVVFLVDGLGFGAGVAGLLLAAGGIGGVLGALAAPRIARGLGTARGTLCCALAGPPLALLIPFAGHGAAVALFVLGEVGMVAAIVAGNVIRGSFTQGYCPRELFGRVTTTQQVANYGAIPLGALLGGWLGDGLGYRAALAVVFLGFLASSLLLLFSPVRRLRDLPTRRDFLSDPAGSIGSRAGRGAGTGGARPRATGGRPGRSRPGVHPRGRRNRQDARDHAPHRLRRAQRRRAARSAARRHVHRPRRR